MLGMIEGLPAANDFQRTIKSQAFSIATTVVQTRWLMYAQEESSVSTPLVGIVVFWLAINFVSFGLFAPRNATVIVTLLLCAAAVSAAIFLIMEMYDPFGGLMRISSAPVRNVIAQIGR